jgi:hypothetical protein
MFSDNAQARPSDFDASEASLRFRMMFAELWHDWFEAMSEVAYQTHRACEFLAENGAPLNGRQSPFDFFSLARSVGRAQWFARHGQASAVLAIDGSDAGGPGHACRSDDAGHGGDSKKKKISYGGNRGGGLVGL